MIDLRDPRWQAIGALLGLYAFIVTSIIAVPELREPLFRTTYGRIAFAVFLLIPVGFLPAMRLIEHRRRPRLSRRDGKAIELTIEKYHQTWITACEKNEPRHLWTITTGECYFEIESKVKECHQKFREYLCQNMALTTFELLKVYAVEDGIAVARADMIWTFTYTTGRQLTKDVSTRYHLMRQDNVWKISRVEHFSLDES